MNPDLGGRSQSKSFDHTPREHARIRADLGHAWFYRLLGIIL